MVSSLVGRVEFQKAFLLIALLSMRFCLMEYPTRIQIDEPIGWYKIDWLFMFSSRFVNTTMQLLEQWGLMSVSWLVSPGVGNPSRDPCIGPW